MVNGKSSTAAFDFQVQILDESLPLFDGLKIARLKHELFVFKWHDLFAEVD